MVHGRPIVEGDELEEVWALRDVSFEVTRGRGRRHHRPQWRGQVDAAEDPEPDHRADDRPRADQRARREPAGGRHRISSRADGTREHLPQRRDPRHDAAGDQAQVRRDRRLCRGRQISRHSGQALFIAACTFAWRLPSRHTWSRKFSSSTRCWRSATVEFQKKCLGKMQEVSKGGRTVLFVSHNLAAVSSLTTRGVVLNAGRVVFNGPSSGRDRALHPPG